MFNHEELAKRIDSLALKLKNTKVSELTDDQLLRIMGRLQIERDYQLLLLDELARTRQDQDVNAHEFLHSALMHYGILGQRWGVRNSRRAGGSGTPYEKQQAMVEKARGSTNAKLVYKMRSNLTDAELRDRLNRIQMEQQLGQISAKQQGQGMKIAKQVLEVGEMATKAYKLYTSPLGQEVKKQITRKLKKAS